MSFAKAASAWSAVRSLGDWFIAALPYLSTMLAVGLLTATSYEGGLDARKRSAPSMRLKFADAAAPLEREPEDRLNSHGGVRLGMAHGPILEALAAFSAAA
jgi:hypothetical protein